MSKYRTIIIKIGSSSLTNKQGTLDTANLARIAGEVAELIKSKKKVIIVTSGAIVSGTEQLKLGRKPKTIPEKQAAAAVGQGLLMRQYAKAFEAFGISVAQILLTRDEISNREKYINTRNTLNALLSMGVVPIINENDTISIDEIKIGDNDTLSALVASLTGADLLVILTDVDGFMMPDEDNEPQVVHVINEITKDIEQAAGRPSTQGVGGMVTKLQAARICSDAGVVMAIGNGRKENVMADIISGKKTGTLFTPKGAHMESRKRWIAQGPSIKGTIVIDGGAEGAIIKENKSLLPVGIKEISGKFDVGDSVSIKNETGLEIGRGLVNYSSDNLKQIIGLRSEKVSEVLGIEYVNEVIHRDNLVLIEKPACRQAGN
jgi:glutamate 5-kinase